jgi:OOP family OmpA-OmpF porin
MPALAQTGVPAALPHFDLDRLSLNPDGQDSLILETGRTSPPGALRLLTALQYQRDPLVLDVNGQRVGALVGSRLTGYVSAAYGLTDSIELAAQLPIILTQGGDSLTAEGLAPASRSALGAPLVQGAFSLLREDRGQPLDLGLVAGLTLPLGSDSAFTRDPGAGASFVPRIGGGHSLGSMFRLGVELGAVVRGSQVLSPYSQQTGDQVGSLVTAGAVVSTRGSGLRGELSARADLPLSHTSAGLELLAGARYPFGQTGLEAFGVAGPGFGAMPGIPAYRLIAGVSWTPSFAPVCAEGQPYALADCPALDRDHDGIPNGQDLCPETPGVAALQGCPDKDSDGDGIPDRLDKCPTVKGNGPDGCPLPVVAPPPAVVDTDGDGIPDSEDACPNEKGIPELKGCPDKDTDGDGVPDRLDRCPTEKGDAANQGCPLAPVVMLEGDHIKATVYFEVNRAALLPESVPVLKEVAQLVKTQPSLARVEINGHTDNRGTREYNLTLSQQRADTVRAFLIQEGLSADLLVAKGFGPDQPVAPNAVAAGRDRNRRVEFILVGSSSK